MELNKHGWVELEFVVCGFSKCGSTSLWSMLSEHPQIYMPQEEKEPMVFMYRQYMERRGWYNRLFADAPPGSICGEARTFYSVRINSLDCRNRLKKIYPGLKLIFIARDPIRRIESSFRELHHHNEVWGSHVSFDISRAIREERFIDDSRYSAIYEEYLYSFPVEQTLVIFAEDLFANPKETLNMCFSFLGADPELSDNIDVHQKLNTSDEKYRDTDALRRMESQIYHPEMAIPLSMLKFDVREQFLRKLGLRKPWKDLDISWDKASLDFVVDEIARDSTDFLVRHGKTADFWPALNAAINGEPVD